MRHPTLGAKLASDMRYHFELGNVFEREQLEAILPLVEEIKALQYQARRVGTTKVKKALEQRSSVLQTLLLENQVRRKTINLIFCETILFLLSTKGSLSTEELHPLIQNIHPDICDDSIDRVIRGQHFGRKVETSGQECSTDLETAGKDRSCQWPLDAGWMIAKIRFSLIIPSPKFMSIQKFPICG